MNGRSTSPRYPVMFKLSKNVRMIGITGRAGSGKDEVANNLEVLLFREGKNYHHVAFANSVKEIARRDFEWDGKKDDIGRKLLQNIGMAYRGIDENYWIWKLNEVIFHLITDLSRRDLSRNLFEPTYIIVSDVRFLNEATYVQNYGPIILVVRNIDEDKDWKNHPSETELTHITPNFIINNSGSLSDLEESVAITWKKVKLERHWL